jgi:hypothetical protein
MTKKTKANKNKEVAVVNAEKQLTPELTLNDLKNMSAEQKDSFTARMVEQLMAAEMNVENKKTKDDIVKIDCTDFEAYKTPFTLYDESEYTVREYLVHDDIAAQFGAQLDGLTRLDEVYKLSLLLDCGDFEASEVPNIIKEILYTQGNAQGIVSKKLKEKAGE